MRGDKQTVKSVCIVGVASIVAHRIPSSAMDKRLARLGKIAIDLISSAARARTSGAGRSRADTAETRTRSSRGGPAKRITMPSFGRSPATPDPRDARRGEVTTAEARPQVSYSPVRDDDADPGEIVWAYVPYEDDPSQGKDRPLLVIGHIESDVAALALTSRPRDDRHHHPIGSGPWDTRGRPSWIKLDRLLRLDPDAIRREGAVLDRARFDAVIATWERY